MAILGAIAATAIDAGLLAWALGGLAALLAHDRALALLAVWFAGALLLGLTRPVRAIEGTRQSRDPLRLLALFGLPLLIPPISAWGERTGLAMFPGGNVRGWLGVGLAAAGLALRFAAMRQLGPRFHPTLAIVPGHALETRGLYARIRHPGYTGALVAALGAVVTFGSALGLVPLALMALVLTARVAAEERMLAGHFGDAWREYRARSGWFLPRFHR